MYKRQESFRYKVDPPIEGVFEIIMIDGKPIKSASGLMNILDISPEGLKIQSKYNISPEKKVELKFSFKLNEAPVNVDGYIMWQKPYINEYTYGVRLEISDSEKARLLEELKLFAKKSTRLKRG